MKKTTVVKNFCMLGTARRLRRDMTPQERKLWYEYFIVDFYCAPARLVIEIDGSQHYTEQGQCYDEERSQILRAYGLKVLRFSNRDVDCNLAGVCTQIDLEVKARL
ncbi:MAG: endonuclease domain-containing protein [Faecalibacterium prausnitzii]|uniref:Endonuclease domain-containing protein n=1 Tax=Faecalibacterium prausnitzii TaxID=853 RepID=A0A943FUK3_9FIRM|nr:endonuclease domain-containing protein [Faecalibacterium prausnitzii]